MSKQKLKPDQADNSEPTSKSPWRISSLGSLIFFGIPRLGGKKKPPKA